MFSQHLYLAASIVSDIRLDRPRNPKAWSVDGIKDQDGNDHEWRPGEMRAVIGLYYLSSW